MRLFTLLTALTCVLVASSEAAVMRRQVEKGRRLVRVRSRQRNGRQLFVDPAPVFVPFNSAPLVQPIELIEVRAQPVQAAKNYGAPVPEVTEVKAVETGYGAPLEEAVVEIRDEEEAPIGYGAPAVRVDNNYAAPVAQVSDESQVIEVRDQDVYVVPQTVASERTTQSKPIGIVRSVYNAPGARLNNDNWDYSFESENGIKQQAVGEMKLVGDSDVIVMRGSYEYIGSDGQVYVVEWEADENGFRASAPHLPKSVPIPFPEQQEAVDAQIRFAAEEDQKNLRAAASESLPSYTRALPVYE